MISSKALKIVQSTAPVLKENSKQIGTHFYELLFSKVPSLYNIFNQTNQKRGLQQEALAYAVYAAGENINNLAAIKPVVMRVAEKHRALGVKADQYPVVGETLLQAVKDVLGDAATDEVIEAWGEAYNYIADIFINIEQELYEETNQKQGGWTGFRDFFVDKKVKESNQITSFYLKPKDGNAIASYQAGQYITLKAEIEGERYTHMRHYSLSDAPGKAYYRISVKREDPQENAPAGIVSNYLHKDVEEGSVLSVSAPAGDFVIADERQPIVLLSGGIGLTPMVSMLNTLVESQPNRSITFIHATINSETHAMREHVAQLEAENDNVNSFVCYESPTTEDRDARNYDKEGLIDLDWLKSILPNNQADFYFCGGIPFTKAINQALKEWGVPKERSHFEVFNPVSILEEA
ncbi:NO-inducible flavohemoprotein [Aquibacillus sp. 3ASR75-11]|uniref:Flavohemoprotein n=1 Tax=Terrihalobacillus insolitus TaxID=2950438 RepID=A0A9X4AQ61_9BACI|nr:NO-inducible flavohemoprotein [Terrihalobacillus insolitus]MDC3413512.1 NO-inducible flavohemoprotein [Terrihalobacillus insolitus]MDC3426308.1 NO-inducible flavohemoprotein [Terrihalobacillus insolitus]